MNTNFIELEFSFYSQYDLKKMIHMLLEQFFESISKFEFDFSDKLNTREFVHVYDFQKCYLYESIRRFTGHVKLKQLHYWNSYEQRNVADWEGLSKLIFFIKLHIFVIIMWFRYCFVVKVWIWMNCRKKQLMQSLIFPLIPLNTVHALKKWANIFALNSVGILILKTSFRLTCLKWASRLTYLT